MSVIPHHRHTGVFFAADRRALAILVEFCERGRDYAIKSYFAASSARCADRTQSGVSSH
jgi:hypothetical protein